MTYSLSRSSLAIIGSALVLIVLMPMATAVANWKATRDEPAEATPAAQCVEVLVLSADTYPGQTEPRNLFEYRKNGKTYRIARRGFFGSAGDRFTYCDYYSQSG